MIKIKLWILLILAMFSFCGCSSKISEKNITEKTGSEIAQELNITNREVQEEKVELAKPNIQEANNLNLTNDIEYEIYFEKFTVKNKDKHTDILIEYPQIKKMKSLEMQKKVNKLLREKAISVYGGEGVEELSLSMKTKVEYSNSNIISVKYTGYGYYFGVANGNDIMYATNINLKTGEIIDINNLFTECFQQKLNRNVFKYNGVDKASEGENIDPNSFEYGYVNGDESIILEMFKNYYSDKATDKYYFSEKNFNIIAKTPSGPTIYLELAASYDDLKDCMNYKDGFWNELLKLK